MERRHNIFTLPYIELPVDFQPPAREKVNGFTANARSTMKSTLMAISLVALLLTVVTWASAFGQIQISEVLADPAGTNEGNQIIEIWNFGSTQVDISSWRICLQFVYRTFPASLSLNPGESYLVHIRADGANDDNNFFTGATYPALNPVSDSFGLYRPAGAFSDPNAIIDFVQWGDRGQPRESVAVDANIWSAGDFVPAAAEGNSIQLCDPLVNNSTVWVEESPTLGAVNDCTVPVEPTTWGRVKGIFR